MIIKRVYLDLDQIGIVIEGKEEYHFMFDLQTVPNADNLIKKIKARVASIDPVHHSPPETDWEPFFNELKTALEGTDIGD